MSKDFTTKEMAAIEALRQLAKTWPRTLTLFSWSGSLVVVHSSDYMDTDVSLNDCPLAQITGIPNDGGDPD